MGGRADKLTGGLKYWSNNKLNTNTLALKDHIRARKAEKKRKFAPVKRKNQKLPLSLHSILIFIQNKQGKIMSNYELMVIFTPVLSEEDYKAAQKKFADLVKDNGGELVHENPWGLKSLAYPIQKKTTGMYLVLEFKAPSDFNDKLKIQLNRDENVLRYMVTKLDKHAQAYNAKKRNTYDAEPKPVEA